MSRRYFRKKVETIGVVAPASPEDNATISGKISTIKKYGFKVVEGPHLYDKKGYLAGEDKDRADDINKFFANPEIDAIICFRGGYGCMRMAKYLDLNTIKKNPKIFCGYSDITLLLNYFSKKCSLVTFHGPMINSKLEDTQTLNSFLNLLCSKNDSFTYNLNSLNCSIPYNDRDFSGRLVGGNLAIICSTIGTPYEIDFTNSILLIEEINESPYAIDRMLTQLLCSQKLNSCKGIILGQFTDCGLKDYSKSLTVDEIIKDRLAPLNIPIISKFPFGHSYPNLVVPIGANASYSSKNKMLSINDTIFI